MDGARRYEATRLRKRGGQAEVLDGVMHGDAGFQLRVAIKRLLPELTSDDSMVRSFIDEARIMSRLHHPNVVRVLDFGSIDGLPFQALELVEGLDLTELEGRAIPEEVALYIAIEVARALEYIHRAEGEDRTPLGIVHRDVTPENILISWTGEVKLADFGIAFAHERLEVTRAGMTKGKTAFMAPEQLYGGGIDGRTDLFALGCVLHYLLAGRSPAGEEDPKKIILDASLPGDLLRVLKRATEPKKTARYPDAAAMAADCGRVLRERTNDPRDTFLAWVTTLRDPKPKSRAVDALFDLGAIAAPDAAKTAATVVEDDRTKLTDPRIGEILRGFRIEQVIESAPETRAYRAQHEVFSRTAIIKVQTDGDDDVLARADAAARVEHPAVTRVLDAGRTSDGHPFWIIEDAAGRTLEDVLAAGPLAPELAQRIFESIATGLAAIHRENIAHGHVDAKHVAIVDQQVKLSEPVAAAAAPGGFAEDRAALERLWLRLAPPAPARPRANLAWSYVLVGVAAIVAGGLCAFLLIRDRSPEPAPIIVDVTPPKPIAPRVQPKEAEAPEREEAPDEAPQEPRPPAKKRASREPSPASELEKRLAARHLSWSDLEGDPALETWRQSKDAEAGAALARRIELLEIDRPLLDRKLQRIRRRLESLAQQTEDPARLAPYDSRFLDLRVAVHSASTDAARRAALAELDALEREIK